MCRNNTIYTIFANNKGFGLIAAVFVVVILAMFGLLIARYTLTSSTSSGEDYVWSQALYSAESVAQLRILCYDGGGNFPGPCNGVGGVEPIVENFAVTIGTDTFTGPNSPDILQVQSTRGNISRQIQVKFIL